MEKRAEEARIEITKLNHLFEQSKTEGLQPILQTISCAVQVGTRITDRENQTAMIETAEADMQTIAVLNTGDSYCQARTESLHSILQTISRAVQTESLQSILQTVSRAVQVNTSISDQENQTATNETAEIDIQTTGVFNTEDSYCQESTTLLSDLETREQTIALRNFGHLISLQYPHLKLVQSKAVQPDVSLVHFIEDSETDILQSSAFTTGIGDIIVEDVGKEAESICKAESTQHVRFMKSTGEQTDQTEELKRIATHEVNVTLTFVKKPVDEHGVVISDLDEQSQEKLEEDDVFLNDSDLDDMEQFLVEESTQTFPYGEKSGFKGQNEDQWPAVEVRALTISSETQTTETHPYSLEFLVDLDRVEENIHEKNHREIAYAEVLRETGTQTDELIMFTKDVQAYYFQIFSVKLALI
uniref:I/LWEQ domain-containing protein n=1 Tax=Angiostrongylus cantonensis TaxID=6313 RepID=A0A0K0CZV2_ANGCA